MDIISTLAIAAYLGILASLFALFQELGRRKKKRKEPPNLQEKISRLTKNLDSSIEAITEIEKEILERKKLVTQLESDTEKYNRLKEISQPQLEAIAQALEIPVKKQTMKSLWVNIVTNFLIGAAFFALGYFLGGK